jgi:hypothetical protein
MSKGWAGLVASISLGVWWSTAALAEQQAAAQDGTYTSTKGRGVVSIVPESALSGGRLILKVVAFNRAQEPAAFGSDNIEVFTAAGTPVPLLSLDTLIAEVQAGGGSSRGSLNSSYQQSSYGRPSVRRTQTGEADVSGYAGANDAVNRDLSAHAATQRQVDTPPSAEAQAQIASLRAAILQRQIIARGAASGGQVVTDKLKFARKETRTLRVVVDFNDERHEFNFEAPSGRR